MRGNEFLDKMDLIDPSFVEAADAVPNVKKKRYIKWGVIAACLCLLMGSVTAMATSDFGTKIVGFFTRGEPGSDYSESGYMLGVEVEKIPQKALKGEIREVPAYIREQFDTYELYMSWYPGLWQKTFESRNDAYDYIGFDGFKKVQFGLEEQETKLNVHGKQNGAITDVVVETSYKVENIRLQFYSHIYTENWEDEITMGFVSTQDVEYTESFYTTANNKKLHVIERTAMESGYMGMTGFLVENGVLYHLNISHLANDTEKAKELLHRWADLF